MSPSTFTTINPATGDPLEDFRALSAAQVDAALTGAVRAQAAWRQVPLNERCKRFRALANLLRERQETYARRMALEMGKVCAEGVAEIQKCARACDWFAEHGEAMMEPEAVTTEASRSRVDFVPLGVLLAVMPWNFPFWQVLRCAVPALLAGNGLALKHAPNVFGCAADIESLFRDAGFPEGLCLSLVVGTAQVASLIQDDRITAVTLTGSVTAGRSVAALAGTALKKCVLELGGSDPFIVLDDADLDQAVPAAVASRFQNCGQSCIAAKRFILLESIRSAFLERFVHAVGQLRVGDPFDPACGLGPMARLDLRRQLHDQVERGVASGARRLLGGILAPGPGAYYPPTVLDQVQEGNACWQEELFGPVAAIASAPDERSAIRLANATRYGLAVSVWTSDPERGERVGGAVESGMCFVNRTPFSDPRMPFGGIKQSGFGRELSIFGLREFANARSVWIEKA